MPRITFFTAAFLFFSINPAAAHIEQGAMPDSVAEMEYSILLEFEPDNLEVRNRLGMVLYRLERLDEAAAEFHYVLNKAPDNFDAIDGLGLVNLKRSNYQLAIDLFKKAIVINPDDILVYSHLGQALEAQDDVAGAAEAYKTGLLREGGARANETDQASRQALLDALKNIHDKAGQTEEHN